jgi:hypothetical protein
MATMVEIVEHEIVQEPQADAQPDTTRPEDSTIENQLTQEITTLWSDHVRLSTDRRTTAKELRQIRASLAERLAAMKSLLSHPGRSGEWRGWLRQHGIPRSTADRLVSRYSETLCVDRGNVPSGAVSDPATPTHEKLATSVWSSLKKTLATGESVVQFVGCLVTAAGIAHEWRPEGLMIFNPVFKAADGVTDTGVSTEATCPAPQVAEGGDANPAAASTADPGPQLSDDVPAAADELPASVPAADPAPEPSCGTPAAVEGLAAEAGLAAAPAETGNGNVV